MTVKGETFEITTEHEEEGRFKASVADKTYDVVCSRISDHHIHMVVNGKGINLFVADTPAGKNIHINGVTRMIADADAAEAGHMKKGGMAVLPDIVTPPMPAVVNALMVAVGDPVEKGQGVLVVSAMKMETTLVSPYAGNVAAIHTAVGEKVMPGDVLIDIHKNSEVSGGPDAEN